MECSPGTLANTDGVCSFFENFSLQLVSRFFLPHFELCLDVIGDSTYICWVSSHGELMTRDIHLYHIFMIADNIITFTD